MTTDLLKAMLTEAAPPAPLARDLGFVVAVMKRVEQRRLYQNLAWLVLGMTALTALLFLIMPYVTPVLTALGQSIWPPVIILTVASFSFIGFEQTRRAFGLRF
jgi:hypothetical protein